MELPDADEVFATFLDRWYDADDRERKGFTHTGPDMIRCYRRGLEGCEISPFGNESQDRILNRIQTMVNTAKTDWPCYLNVSGEISDEWIAESDAFYDAEQVWSLIRRSDPSDFSNDLLVTVCQFGAVLGEVLRQHLPRLQWIPEWPYWESGLYDPSSGEFIPPFHWAIKKFSDYGVDDGYVAKIHCCLHVLDEANSE